MPTRGAASSPSARDSTAAAGSSGRQGKKAAAPAESSSEEEDASSSEEHGSGSEEENSSDSSAPSLGRKSKQQGSRPSQSSRRSSKARTGTAARTAEEQRAFTAALKEAKGDVELAIRITLRIVNRGYYCGKCKQQASLSPCNKCGTLRDDAHYAEIWLKRLRDGEKPTQRSDRDAIEKSRAKALAAALQLTDGDQQLAEDVAFLMRELQWTCESKHYGRANPCHCGLTRSDESYRATAEREFGKLRLLQQRLHLFHAQQQRGGAAAAGAGSSFRPSATQRHSVSRSAAGAAAEDNDSENESASEGRGKESSTASSSRGSDGSYESDEEPDAAKTKHSAHKSGSHGRGASSARAADESDGLTEEQRAFTVALKETKGDVALAVRVTLRILERLFLCHFCKRQGGSSPCSCGTLRDDAHYASFYLKQLRDGEAPSKRGDRANIEKSRAKALAAALQLTNGDRQLAEDVEFATRLRKWSCSSASCKHMSVSTPCSSCGTARLDASYRSAAERQLRRIRELQQRLLLFHAEQQSGGVPAAGSAAACAAAHSHSRPRSKPVSYTHLTLPTT